MNLETAVKLAVATRATKVRRKVDMLPWLFVAPTLVVLGLLVIWPVVYSLYLSGNEVVIRGGGMVFKWVGVDNYLNLVTNPRFVRALGQTGLFAVAHVTLVTGLSLGLALLVHELGRAEKLVTPMLLLPWALSFVVNAVVWQWIFHGSFGLLNALAYGAGVIPEYRSWLADPNWALPLLTLAGAWKAVSFPTMMMLASLKGVPEELMDAAKIDGAGVWQRFLQVSLPHLRPVVVVVVVLQSMWALKTFDIFWTLTKGGPMDRTLLLSVFSYQTSFVYSDYGSGAAAAYVITGLTLALTWLYVRVLKVEEV